MVLLRGEYCLDEDVFEERNLALDKMFQEVYYRDGHDLASQPRYLDVGEPLSHRVPAEAIKGVVEDLSPWLRVQKRVLFKIAGEALVQKAEIVDYAVLHIESLQ